MITIFCTCRRNKNCKSKPTLPKVRLKHSTTRLKTLSYSRNQLTDDKTVFAALAGREVSALPEQCDTPRPYHQVTAAPTQEEETTQHQCTIPGQYCLRPLLVNLWTVTTSVTQQQLIRTTRQIALIFTFTWLFFTTYCIKQKDKRHSVT